MPSYRWTLKVEGEDQMLTAEEFEKLIEWKKSCSNPDVIESLFVQLIEDYTNLIHNKKKSADILKALRQSMGILPTSERGSQLSSPLS